VGVGSGREGDGGYQMVDKVAEESDDRGGQSAVNALECALELGHQAVTQ
jgi:hypothetical protein